MTKKDQPKCEKSRQYVDVGRGHFVGAVEDQRIPINHHGPNQGSVWQGKNYTEKLSTVWDPTIQSKRIRKYALNSPQKFREYHVCFETWQWWCDVYTCIYIPDENVPQSIGIIAEVQEKILPLILPVSKLIHKTSVLNLCTIQNFSSIAFTSCGFFMHWLVVCNRLSWQ